MPKPSQADQQRQRLLPIVCHVFSRRGYRRATTAEIARACKVRENVLYRLWADKKAMFLAAINDVFERRAAAWRTLLDDRPAAREAGRRLVAYEAEHQGEFGFYRVVFTALGGDRRRGHPGRLVRMYGQFHQAVLAQSRPWQEQLQAGPCRAEL